MERKSKDKEAVAFVNKCRRNCHIQSGGGKCMFAKPD
jgi:hypothetical protein